MNDPTSVVATDLGVALDDVVLLAPTSFSLGAGRVLAVTGPNGSGKTTLLRAVAGRVKPSTGSVLVAGRVPSDRDPQFRGRLAALLGLPPLARNLTLREHLVLVAASWGLPLETSADSADSLLGELGIDALRRRFPHELSSGQTQLFALALTLIRPCEVLLLDEPEQRLDPERVQLVAAAVRARADVGITVLLASHSPVLADQVADDALALSERAHERFD